tara:strand:- start:3003 stop:3383 length:381 start_codon:yes stop_codon:yes gene_type:complete
MKTSYRDISNNQVEVSVTQGDEETIIGVLQSDQYGKWSCIHPYFPVPTHLKDTVENKDSMVECGRRLVESWQKYGAQQRFDEKLRQIRKQEREAEELRNKQREEEEQEYWDSLWNMDTYDPFEGEQ